MPRLNYRDLFLSKLCHIGRCVGSYCIQLTAHYITFSSISARRAFVDLHFGQPWLSSSKTSSSVCELPSRVRFIFLSLRASQDIFGLFLGITELLFCEKWPYSGPRRSNFNRAIEKRPSWSASTPVDQGVDDDYDDDEEEEDDNSDG